MSKKQTPITAEGWHNENRKTLFAVKNTKGYLQYPFVSQNAHKRVEEHIYKIMEEYAKAKVLEALEKEFFKLLKVIPDRRYTAQTDAKEYYKTYVKPKYKKEG